MLTLLKTNKQPNPVGEVKDKSKNKYLLLL